MARFSNLVRGFLVLAIFMVPAGAHAWELSMSGVSSFSYLYYSQRGPQGFFGKYNMDQTTAVFLSDQPGDYAVVNGWLGTQVRDPDNNSQIVSGSDASKSFFSTSIFPQISVNPAMRFAGVYRIGDADSVAFPGATVTFANGQWLQWWAVMELPWGRVVYGKRPLAFGCGLQFDVTNRTEEHLTLSAGYGPMTFGLGTYPWRRGNQLFRLPSNITYDVYWNRYDKNDVPIKDLFAFINYEAANIETGVGGLFSTAHYGPEGFQIATRRQGFAPLDLWDTEGWVYLKYNNGRFFFNAEADWHYRSARFQGSANGNFEDAEGNALGAPTPGSGSYFRSRYTEAWRYMVETGFVAGPLKTSFLYAFLPGPDRRHGVLIDKQAVVIDLYRPAHDVVIFDQNQGNSVVFQPYSMILNTAYGSGVGCIGQPNISGAANGYMADASVFAGRVDYALAANLNVYGSFTKAKRSSHGYPWGFIYPIRVTGFRVVYDQSLTRNFGAPCPSIPDSDLGWEVNGGLNWALLDNTELSVSAGYWQPGKWFSYACMDKNVVNWNTAWTAANWWGTNPGRTIDPIVAINWSLALRF